MNASECLATIVVTPRERFSTAMRCLPVLIERTRCPHRLVYVAGGAPPHIRAFLEDTCKQPTHELILKPEFLSPNAARNIGLRSVHTKYAVFIDNDVIVEPGWLEALVRCAEETGADIVGPLCLFGEPEKGIIHSAGGDIRLEEQAGVRVLFEKHRLTDVNLKSTPVDLKRAPCDYVEFHCMLTRRDLFERNGLMDEKILSTGEHMDLALEARRLGGKTYTETDSIVSYLTDAPYEISDTGLFQLRWCDEWNQASLEHFATKWRLDRHCLFFKDYESFLVRQQEICRLPRPAKTPALTAASASQAFAQCLPQLMQQLQALGYRTWEMETAKQAFSCAEALFTGIYRESGKPLIGHCVGTASVLAHYGAPISVVVAGLLHPAYPYGRFLGLAPSTLAAQRRWIESKMGWQAEALIFGVTQIEFQKAHASVIAGNFDRLPLNMAYNVLMRIANSVDEHLYDGMALHHNPAKVLEQNKQQLDRWDAVYRKVADCLGCSAMLDLLHDLHASASKKVPPTPGASAPGSYEFDPHTGARTPVQPRTVNEEIQAHTLNATLRTKLIERLRSMKVGTQIHRVKLKCLRSENKGRVHPSRRLADRLLKPGTYSIETDKEQWSYSATVDIKPDEERSGPAVLRMQAQVDHGTVGVGLLRAQSNDEFVVPEQGLEQSNAPMTILIPMPELEEAGRLIFRNWAGTQEPSRMRIFSITLHQPAGEQ